ncbi:MAG: hypothetical protein RI897_1862 [Verrucomicrobiota bacterium]
MHPETPASLLQGYPQPTPTPDEWFEHNHQLLPHISPLLSALNKLGLPELTHRRETARRMMRNHGMNYDALGDRQGLERLWDIDPLPLPISAPEFSLLETALRQRCTVLNALLADCYGPQNLIRDQVIPASILHANPGFLYPAHQLPPAQNRYLVLHAADLARNANGQWQVLADHTQTPSGTGYALENRLVILRILPEEFRTCQVRRLAAYFQYQRETLSHLAPNPNHTNIVFLTPGPHAQNYFEHAYLARYLALPLVECTDLTVRQSKVFLKTLEGLQPIDVILRQTPDNQLDPLELGDAAIHGVPGLLQAIRSGSVALVNPLGSGLAEAPAWSAFLPQICEYLLHEPLLLPSTPTWWCGSPHHLQTALSQFDTLQFRPAFNPDSEPSTPSKLHPKDRDALLRNIQNNPHHYVAQPLPQLSVAPALLNKSIQPHPVLLRTFTCHGHEGIEVMPGGLTRILTQSASPHSSRSGGTTKDTWILSETPVAPVSLIHTPTSTARLERAAAEVPSRVADNLFWLGRYSERLEDLARTLRCILTRLVSEASFDKTPDLLGLVQMMVHLEILPDQFKHDFPIRTLARETHALIHETHRLGTLPELLSRLHRITWNVRDRLSTDTWRTLNRLQNDARPASRHPSLADSLLLLNNLIANLAALTGLQSENMTRGHAWRFLQLGRRLERAANITTLTLAGLHTQDEHLRVLEPMLEIADSTMTYRRLYFAQPLLAGVLDLLLADETNPRALAFQLASLQEHSTHLPNPPTITPGNDLTDSIHQAIQTLQSAQLDHLEPVISNERRLQITQTLRDITAILPRLSDHITHRFFSHAETRVS